MTETTTEIERGDVFSLLPTLPDDYGHAAVVDYPWEFDTQNGTNRFGSDGLAGGDDDLYDLEENDGLVDVVAQLPRVVADGGWVFVFADDDTLPQFRACVESEPGLTYRRTWVWDRVNFGMGYYGRVQHLPIITATVGDTDRYVQSQGTVLSAKKTGAASDYHTAKPVELYRKMLAETIERGERLLEPFFGTAPGLAVAQDRGLSYWGADVSSEAHEIANGRLEQATLTGE